MTFSDWFLAGSSLLGALIGASAALLGAFQQRRSDARTQVRADAQRAVQQVLRLSQVMDLRAHEIVLVSTNVGSLGGVAMRVIGAVAPVDFMALFDRLDSTADALLGAAVEVKMLADSRTIELCDEVIACAMKIVTAHHEPSTPRAVNMARIALTGRHAKDVVRIADARAALQERHAALTQHVRSTM